MRPLALTVLLATAAAAAAGESVDLVNELERKDITVSVRPVLGRHYRPGEAIPLSVVVANGGPPVRARVSVVAGGGSGVRFETAAAVGLSGTRRIELAAALTGPGEAPVVEITPEGESPVFRAKMAGLLRPLGSTDRLVVFTADYPPLVAVRPPSGRSGGLTARVVEVPSGALPSRAVDYSGVDLVIIDELNPATLSSRQREALVTWIRSGGRFMITSRTALMSLSNQLFRRRAPGEPGDWEAWKRVYGGSDSDVVLRRGGEPAIVRVRPGFGRGVILGFSLRDWEKAEWAESGAAEYHSLLAEAGRGSGDARIRPELFDALPTRGEFSEVVLRIRAAVVAFVVVLGVLIGLTHRPGRGRLFALATIGGASVLLAVGAAVFVPKPATTSVSFSVAETAPDGSALRRRVYRQVTSFRGSAFSTGEVPAGMLVRALAYDWGELKAHRYAVLQGKSVSLSEMFVPQDLPALVEISSAEMTSPSAPVPLGIEGRSWVLWHSAAGDLSPGALFDGKAVRPVLSKAGGAPALGDAEPVSEYLKRVFPSDEIRRKLTRYLLDQARRRPGAFLFGWRDAPPGAPGLPGPSGKPPLGEFLVVCLEERKP